MSILSVNVSEKKRNRNLIQSLSKNYETLIKAEKELLANKNDLHKIINYLDSNKFQSDFDQEYSRYKIYEQNSSSINSSFRQETLSIKEKEEQKPDYPSAYLHGLFCLDVYENESKTNTSPILERIREMKNEENWNAYKVIEIQLRQYKSVVYLNKVKKQMVLAHKGFDANINPFVSNQKVDYEDIALSQIIPQLAVCFQITKQVNAIAIENNYNLSFTGYSHGAWLSQYAFYFARKYLHNSNTKAVLFESPGSVFEYDEKIFPNTDLVVYLIAPSLANTCNEHFGKVYRIFFEENSKDFRESQAFVNNLFKDLSNFNEINEKILSSKFICDGIYSIFNQQRLKALVEALKQDWICTEEVIRWPQVSVEQRNQSASRNLNDMIETFVENILSTHQFPKVVQSIPKYIQDCIIRNTMSGLFRNLIPSLHTVCSILTELDKKKTNLDELSNREDFYQRSNGRTQPIKLDYQTREVNRSEDRQSLNDTSTTLNSYELKTFFTSDDQQSVSSSIYDEIDYLLGQDTNTVNYPLEKLDLLIIKLVNDCKHIASSNRLDELNVFYETMIKLRNFIAKTKVKVKLANYLGLLCLLSLYEYKVSMNLNGHLNLELEIQQILKQILPQNHPVLANSFKILGDIYYKLSDKDKAIECFQQALRISKKAMKEFHPDVANLLGTLGKVYNELGEINMAITYYSELLRITKKLSANHSDIPFLLNKLATFYWDLNETKMAINYYSEALDFRRQHCPESYSDIVNTFNNLGAAHSKLGQTNIAISFYYESIKLKDCLPNNSPYIAISYNNLAAAFSKFGDLNKAIEYYKESLKLIKNTKPINNIAISSTLFNLGSCYTKLNENSKAYQCYTESMQIVKEILPENHQFRINLATSLENSTKTLNKIDIQSTRINKKKSK